MIGFKRTGVNECKIQTKENRFFSLTQARSVNASKVQTKKR